MVVLIGIPSGMPGFQLIRLSDGIISPEVEDPSSPSAPSTPPPPPHSFRKIEKIIVNKTVNRIILENFFMIHYSPFSEL
jgi:hypothetical protein